MKTTKVIIEYNVAAEDERQLDWAVRVLNDVLGFATDHVNNRLKDGHVRSTLKKTVVNHGVRGAKADWVVIDEAKEFPKS